MSLLQPPRLREIPAPWRITSTGCVIAVVDTLRGAPVAPHLAAAFGPRAVRTRVLLRNKPGFDLQNGNAASHPDSVIEAASALIASLPPHDVLIAEGPALLAALSPRLAILATPSPSLATLDPDVRSQRDRFDLVLYDFRAATLDRLVSALAS